MRLPDYMFQFDLTCIDGALLLSTQTQNMCEFSDDASSMFGVQEIDKERLLELFAATIHQTRSFDSSVSVRPKATLGRKQVLKI